MIIIRENKFSFPKCEVWSNFYVWRREQNSDPRTVKPALVRLTFQGEREFRLPWISNHIQPINHARRSCKPNLNGNRQLKMEQGEGERGSRHQLWTAETVHLNNGWRQLDWEIILLTVRISQREVTHDRWHANNILVLKILNPLNQVHSWWQWWRRKGKTCCLMRQRMWKNKWAGRISSCWNR